MIGNLINNIKKVAKPEKIIIHIFLIAQLVLAYFSLLKGIESLLLALSVKEYRNYYMVPTSILLFAFFFISYLCLKMTRNRDKITKKDKKFWRNFWLNVFIGLFIILSIVVLLSIPLFHLIKLKVDIWLYGWYNLDYETLMTSVYMLDIIVFYIFFIAAPLIIILMNRISKVENFYEILNELKKIILKDYLDALFFTFLMIIGILMCRTIAGRNDELFFSLLSIPTYTIFLLLDLM